MVNLLLDDCPAAMFTSFAGCSSSASAPISPSEPDHDDIRLALLLCCLDLLVVILLLGCFDSFAVDAGVLVFFSFTVFIDDDDDDEEEDDDDAVAATK